MTFYEAPQPPRTAAPPTAQQTSAFPAQASVDPADQEAQRARPPKKDHRFAVQSEKLRLAALSSAIRFGDTTPSVKPRTFGILLGSLAIGLVILGGTVGISALLQWIANR